MMIASLAAGGCSFSGSNKPADAHGIDTSHDGPPDSTIDGPPDAAQQDFGTGAWTVHVPTLPTASVSLMGSIDTGPASQDCMMTAMWTDGSQPDACFIVGTTIGTSNAIVVHGPRPLVLVATDAITIDANLDVSSRRGQAAGPAANWSGCATPSAGGSRNNVGGGGAGGTYITVGGSGGAGDNGQATAGLASNTMMPAPSILHGGCRGSNGGTGGTGPQSTGAASGGALYLVAGKSITISAIVNASGSGVSAGGHASGGGGGGSGGTLIMYAPAITATGGTLVANGGGGAGGGDNNSNGTSGGDAMTADPTAQATGGNGPGGGGGSGYSSQGDAGVGVGGSPGDGGGGGGGGAGYIRSNVTLTGAIASPAVDVVP
jgi:hypothetical protein